MDYQLPETAEAYQRFIPQRPKRRAVLQADEEQTYGVLVMELRTQISNIFKSDAVGLLVERQAWGALQDIHPRLRMFDGPEKSNG